MRQISTKAAGRAETSILVVSPDPVFCQCMNVMGSMWDDVRVASDAGSFKKMNGSAARLASEHDVVLFEADPDDEGEFEATRELLDQRSDKTIFIALTASDLPIAKARMLTDIGVDEVLPKSISEGGLKRLIEQTLAARVRPQAEAAPAASGRPAKLIAVTQARGGIGATTLAVNLACDLARPGGSFLRKQEPKRVALLDFDLQFGNANVFLDLEDKGGFMDLIDGDGVLDENLLAEAMQRHETGVDVLCAPASVAPLQLVSVDTIQAIIDLLQQHYDYIVVDMPRALVDWIEPVIQAATQLLIVTDTSVPSVRHAKRLMDFFREDRADLPVEMVVNHEKKPLFKSEHIREAEKVLKTKLSFWLPDNPKVARKSADLGRPIVREMMGSDLGKALSHVSKMLVADPRHGTPTAS